MMGMYDTVACEVDLPDRVGDDDELQTKDLDCSLSTYTITKDGRLIVDKWHYEAVPKDELPYPDRPYIGSIRRIVDLSDVDQNYHGMLNFYDENNDWVAKFTDGKLVSIERHPPTPPTGRGPTTMRRG